MQLLAPAAIKHEVVVEVRVPDGADATVILILPDAVPPAPLHETV